jgi:hypothetical protein
MADLEDMPGATSSRENPQPSPAPHRSAPVSIRRIHPGRHIIDVQVNGRVLGTVGLEVVDPTAATR